MKRKETKKIGLIIALLMLTSLFTAIPISAQDTPSGHLIITKQIYNPQSQTWGLTLDAKTGDIIQFKITIMYYNDTEAFERHASEFIVKDMLPAGLQFLNTVEITNSSIYPAPSATVSGNNVYWNFTGLYNRSIYNLSSFDIRFNVSVIGCGDLVNIVNISAKEHCSGMDLFGEAQATVTVHTSLDVEKKVWDLDANQGRGGWVENLSYVTKGQKVRFQITSTYHGCGLMKCAFVWDVLPECLEYTDTVSIKIAGVTIPPSNLIDSSYPLIIPGGSGVTITICGHEIPVEGVNNVIWDWRNRDFALSDGKSVVIEYEANVTHYCDCPQGTLFANTANVYIWGCTICDPCNYVHGSDTANITCCQPPPRFTKQVMDGRQQWVEETTAVVGDTVRFKLALTYHGTQNEFTVRIVDQLPDCLEYADAATREPSNISIDKKTIWWNFTKWLNDTEVLSIEFNALVTNTTECCGGINNATITIRNCTNVEQTFTDTASVIGIANTPPSRPVLNGPTSGQVGQQLTFTVGSDDLDGDQVSYFMDWGNSALISGYYPEGVLQSINHSWATAGTYHVRAYTIDVHGAASDWSFNTITVVITGGVTPPPPSQGENITITSVTVKSSGVTATIKNNGTENNKLVNWTIKVEGKLFTRKDVVTSGNVTINSTKTADVSGASHAKRFAFGRFTVTVTADAGPYGKATATKTGFMFGPFFRVK